MESDGSQEIKERTTGVEPRQGPGRFQWSAGGWFGGLFGGSSWMLLCPVLLASRAPNVALIWAGCGLTTIAVGVRLWSQRARLLPYPAIMGMFLAQWIASCVAVVSLVVLAPRSANPFEANTLLMFGCLLVFPLLMIQFTVMERSA